MFKKAIKNIINTFTLKELLKSLLTGLIFLCLLISTILVIAINLGVVLYQYLPYIIEISAILVYLSGVYSVNRTYEAMLNYHEELQEEIMYIRKIDVIITPLILFILVHLIYIFI